MPLYPYTCNDCGDFQAWRSMAACDQSAVCVRAAENPRGARLPLPVFWEWINICALPICVMKKALTNLEWCAKITVTTATDTTVMPLAPQTGWSRTFISRRAAR
jgi:putative FmdB family regulatory protein